MAGRKISDSFLGGSWYTKAQQRPSPVTQRDRTQKERQLKETDPDLCKLDQFQTDIMIRKQSNAAENCVAFKLRLIPKLIGDIETNWCSDWESLSDRSIETGENGFSFVTMKRVSIPH